MRDPRSVRKARKLSLEEAWRSVLPPRLLVAAVDGGRMARRLRQDGYHVDEAPDGAELVRRLGDLAPTPERREPYDLLIAEASLPGPPSSLGVLRAIREVDWAVPVVLVTDPGDVESRREGHRLGARILDGSFDIDDLRTLVVNTVPSPR